MLFFEKIVFHGENVENVENSGKNRAKKRQKQGQAQKFPTLFSTLSPCFCGKLKKSKNRQLAQIFLFMVEKWTGAIVKKWLFLSEIYPEMDSPNVK